MDPVLARRKICRWSSGRKRIWLGELKCPPGSDQVTNSHIAAYDAGTGRERWRTSRGNFVGGYSTPVLMGADVVVSGPVEMIAYLTAPCG